MTVKQLLKNIDSRELSEWMALKIVESKEGQRAELIAKAQDREKRLRNKRTWPQ